MCFPVLHCLPLRISLLPLDPFHLFAFLSVMYASILSTFIASCIQLYFVSATMFNVALVINKDSVLFSSKESINLLPARFAMLLVV